MKKCNYFSSLVTLLLLFFGMNLNAQSYLSPKEAISVIQDVISQNTKKSAAINPNTNTGAGITSTAVQSYAALDRPEKIKLLKLDYGKYLLTEISAGLLVESAIIKVSSFYEISSKRKDSLDIFKEVDAFYKSLLYR